jgi:hypothetical protein
VSGVGWSLRSGMEVDLVRMEVTLVRMEVGLVRTESGEPP